MCFIAEIFEAGMGDNTLHYQKLINGFIVMCQNVLQNQLTGIYLHGSMAMGCFNPDRSDIDIVVIVEDSITYEQKYSLMGQIVSLNMNAPAKGLEISFIKKEYCKPFVYPTPFELHFSPMHLQWFYDSPKDYIHKMNGEDKDLAAHFMIINKYGIRLCGKEISEVFGTVPREYYIESIWQDIENAQRNILDNPVYVILNLCRVLAYIKDQLVLSKVKGGEWGLAYLEKEHHALILQTLLCYKSTQVMQVNDRIVLKFADAMLDKISLEKGFRY